MEQADASRREGSDAGHTPGYRVERNGDVFSEATNWRGYGARKMQPSLDSHGYPSVRITTNGKRTRIPVHRLVARAFLPPRPSPQHEVRHLDGNKNNPHADNLAWGTRKENADDRERHGRTSRGLRHSQFIKAGLEARND